MNRDENLFFAKKLFVELVFNSAYIEGCNVTFPQTQTILDGAVVNNVAVSDIQTVLNLRDGWKYVLGHIDDDLNLDFSKRQTNADFMNFSGRRSAALSGLFFRSRPGACFMTQTR